jgi:5'-nucleotidase (lipoprotein e(P4) family)
MRTKKQTFYGVIGLAALCCFCHQEGGRTSPRDIQWVRESVEYQVLCIQTYRSALQHVRTYSPWLQKNWVVILDVDMTVLDNSPYQEMLHEKNQPFPFGWEDYLRRAECPPVPGVNTFVDGVRALGEHAHIAYITNRDASLADATLENLRAVGLWEEGDVLLCRENREDTKEMRRNEVKQGIGRCSGRGEREIVAMIGDQLLDFEPYPTDLSGGTLKSHYLEPGSWKEGNFILPNPMYGEWMGGYRR